MVNRSFPDDTTNVTDRLRVSSEPDGGTVRMTESLATLSLYSFVTPVWPNPARRSASWATARDSPDTFGTVEYRPETIHHAPTPASSPSSKMTRVMMIVLRRRRWRAVLVRVGGLPGGGAPGRPANARRPFPSAVADPCDGPATAVSCRPASTPTRSVESSAAAISPVLPFMRAVESEPTRGTGPRRRGGGIGTTGRPSVGRI